MHEDDKLSYLRTNSQGDHYILKYDFLMHESVIQNIMHKVLGTVVKLVSFVSLSASQ